MKKSTFLIAAALLTAQTMLAQTADKVFQNGKIYTAYDAQPFAEAIAIKDGSFIFVGSNAGVAAHIGAGTIVEDLDGRLVLPGIHDVHIHPLEAGSPNAGDCGLDGYETDPENLGLALQACNLTPNSNGWIMAYGHSIFTLYEAVRPPKEILDDYYPDDPMVVIEETSHSVWVNSVALQTLGITAATPDPVGGHIFKDPFTGEPDGILMDNAGDAALAAALAPNAIIDSLNYDGLVNYSLPLLAENGITSICEGRTYWKRNYPQIWQKIKDDGLLTARVVLAPWVYPGDDDAVQIPIIQNLYNAGDDMLKISQIKVYSDGIAVNATAALHEPYNDNLGLPFDTGLNYIDENRLTNLIATLEQTGFDFHIHAIGDRGITEAINAIENARNINGDIGARHRVTHLEIVDTADYGRFAPLGIIADMQVAGDFTNPDQWHENDFLIGSERSDNLIPLKSIFNTGAKITLSSDWDVSSVNPFVAMQNALTRAPQELPTVEDAVKSYTINGAYTMRQETTTGSIEVGKFADFICVDQDIFTIPKNQVAQTNVLSTHLAGMEIYRSSVLAINGTEGYDALNFKLFPNPSNGKIKIDISDIKAESVTIYSIDGELKKEIIIGNGNTVEFDTSNFSKGVYLVELKLLNGHHLTSKFIKE